MQCCFVYIVTKETSILSLQKQHLVAKNEFVFSFRPKQITNKWAGNMKRLGIRFKNDSFRVQSRLFRLRDNNFIHGALSDLKLCRMFSFT